jgi:hypothetical protein
VKILLHMGQGKTGTTALQEALHSAAPVLRGKGVFYPHFGGDSIAHHLLLPLCEHPDRLPPWSLRKMGGVEAVVERAWDAWNATCDAVLADPPDTLLLSSELLIHQTSARAKQRLAATLAELSTDVTPILYVRDPVAQYRARLQEWLKVESAPLPPTRLHLREAIQNTEAAFAALPQLVAFDRAALHGGDITTDFATRFLGRGIAADDLPPRQANVGLSAEALVLLARLRAEGGHSPRVILRGARLVRHLAALDLADPPEQPLTLLPAVADAALRAATCHRWLAETGRLTLPGLDTDQIDGAPVPDWLMRAAPETLFPHDPDRLDRLYRALRQSHPKLLQG